MAKLLHQTLLNVLKTASEKLDAESIALPAISSGIYGIPIDLCASVYHNAIKEFSAVISKQNKLMDIRIVINAEDAVGSFILEFAEAEVSTSSSQTYSEERSRKQGFFPSSPQPSWVFAENLYYNQAAFDSMKLTGIKTDKANVATVAKESKNCKLCMKTGVVVMTMNSCQDTLCKTCFDSHFENGSHCPVCNRIVLLQRGHQPKGKMETYFENDQHLPGYTTDGTVVVKFDIPEGTQTNVNPNRGKPYTGVSMVSYLPSNEEGRLVLDMLKKAFDLGLLFTINTSNCVVPNDVHFKTSRTGGPVVHGYPDPNYLHRVKEELTAKGLQ
ncbi:E3 ubiquitin-protein ligase DTX3L-like [Glandiceps talaboti]